jgi:hypothetical protein
MRLTLGSIEACDLLGVLARTAMSRAAAFGKAPLRFVDQNIRAVIPGRRAAANPESRRPRPLAPQSVFRIHAKMRGPE